ncbi:MAG TPA: acyl-CoA dehydrogenase family protein [Chloroflexota bacterium]
MGTLRSTLRVTEPSGLDYLDKARQLGPEIAAAADDIERQRQLPEALVDKLIGAGLFRLLLPRDFGGAEVDPVTFVRVINEIAKADASTAWVLCQTAGCSMAAAYLAPQVAGAIYADERDIVAWGPPSGVKAIAEPGGYRVSGTWHFASGGRHASWFGAACTLCDAEGQPRLRPDGSPDEQTLMIPASQARMNDVWQVIGLKGTGSDSYTIEDLFVPEERCAPRDDPTRVRHPGRLYLFPIRSMFSAGFSGVGLGIARSALDGFVELARHKTPRGFSRPIGENGVVQLQVAQAEGQLRAAECFLFDTLEEVWQAVTASGCLSPDQRVLVRLAASHGLQAARDVVDRAYQLAGSTAIFTGGGIERRFRDMHAVSQQIQARQDHFEIVGRHLLGLEAESPFM